MKDFTVISAMIKDELDGAENYIKEAIRVREEDPTASELYFNHARDEMKHADELHELAVKKIRTYRAEQGEPPAPMQAVYDFLHEAHMERASRIHWYITKYTEK